MMGTHQIITPAAQQLIRVLLSEIFNATKAVEKVPAPNQLQAATATHRTKRSGPQSASYMQQASHASKSAGSISVSRKQVSRFNISVTQASQQVQ
jgi:hypothetical protein